MAATRLLGACRLLTRQASATANDAIQRRLFSSSYMLSGKFIDYQVKDGVAVIKFDTPDSKVNTLSEASMKELVEAFEKSEKDQSVSSAVLISGKPECFIAGADVNMLQACKTKEDVKNLSLNSHKALAQVEKGKKPVVAAIMGSCLGGGLEVALSCHYRIAVDDKKTGLGAPEVLLGILPGAGGTQRLPKLVSVTDALDMTLTGRNIKPVKAKRMGLVDMVVSPLGPGIKSPTERTRDYLEEIAINTAKSLADGTLKRTPKKKNMMDKIISQLLKYEFGRNYIFNQAKGKVMKQTAGLYPAPLKIIDVIKTHVEKGEAAGYEAEAENFGDLVMTNESNALMGLFHGQTNCKKNNYGVPERPVKSIGVLGAGLMGAGVVQVSVDKGYKVILKDMALAGLTRGQQQIEKGLSTSVKKRKITSFQKGEILSHLDSTLDYEGFDQLDMVIEAVFEDINIKHKVIKELEQHIPPHCIIASNTSALPIKDIAKASKNPEKVIGMHYFSPVDKMQLMEIIVTDQTSKDTIASAVDVSLKQGKTVIVVKDGPGFYTTRALALLSAEVFSVLQEGVSPQDVNKLSRKIGFPVGLATLVDEVGVDVAAHIAKYLGGIYSSRCSDPVAMEQVLSQMVAGGMMGRKSGQGMFLYEGQGKARPENPKALEILKNFKVEPKLPLTDENLRARLLGKFVNEAVLCLQEGILSNPIEGDIGLVFGLGFPPFLGGPFRYVDNLGADKFVSEMERLAAAYGSQFEPCQLLKDHAKDKTLKFHQK